MLRDRVPSVPLGPQWKHDHNCHKRVPPVRAASLQLLVGLPRGNRTRADLHAAATNGKPSDRQLPRW